MPEKQNSDTVDPQPTSTTGAPAPADSSPASQPAAGAAKAPAEPSVESIVQGVLDAQPREGDSQPAAEGEEGSEARTSSITEREEGKTDQPPPTEREEGPVPYSRFKEKNEEAAKLAQEVEAFKPIATAAQRTNEFLARHGVTQEEFQDALDTLALMKADPKKALEKLTEVSNSLRQFDPESLPPAIAEKIAKLKDRVEEGDISAAHAKELEDAWRAQGRSETQARLGQRSNQQTQADRDKAYRDSMVNAVNQWDASMRKNDPDYKPKAKADEVDGLFEIANAKFMAGLATTQIRTPADLVKVLESAYTDAKKLFTTRLALKPTRPAPSANGSHVTSPRKAPETDEEVVADILKRNHGIVYTPRVSA